MQEPDQATDLDHDQDQAVDMVVATAAERILGQNVSHGKNQIILEAEAATS